MARSTITEAAAAPAASTPGRLLVGLITPGWGSSGYYPPTVVEAAAADKVWPKGTHVYFDHPSESEQYDRPERSVRDLAAVFTEDARWDGTGLVAEVDVIGPYRDLVTDPVFAEAVGMSIRASAEGEAGEAEGRQGRIFTRLVEGLSVDLVTKAGRGGKILAVLESSRAEAREALTGETRDLLSLAVGDGAWVVDFDPDESTVIYRREWEAGGTYHTALVRDGYTVTDGVAALAGAPEQVRQTTSYLPVPTAEAHRAAAATDPTNIRIWGTDTPGVYQFHAEAKRRFPINVPAPAGQPDQHPTPNVQEDTMGTIQVDEAEHGRLTAAAGRVPTLEAERDAAVQERDKLREALAQRDRADAARDIITARATEAGVTFTALETRGLLTQLPVTEAGELDSAAFTTAVDADAAAKAQEAGAGQVRGFGSATADGAISESDARAFLYGEQKGA